MSGLLMPVQYGTPSTSYQDDESLCSSRQGLIRSQRSSTVSSTTAEERTALKRDAEDAYQESKFTTIRLTIKRLLLFSLVAVSLLVLSSLFTAIIMHSLSASTCTSISCVTAAETLRHKSAAAAASQNHSSVSPCEDFYEYACAGWKENSIVRTMRSREWNIALDTTYKSHDRIRNLFSRLMVNPEAQILTKNQKEAVSTYMSCITESIEDATKALQLVYQEFGGWLSTAQDDRSIEESLLGGYRLNAVSLFHINAMIDTKDIRKRSILTIEQAAPYTGIPMLYLAEDSFDVQELLDGRRDGHWIESLLFKSGLELGKELEMDITPKFKKALAQAILLDYKITRCSPAYAGHGEPPAPWRTTVGELATFEKLFNFRYFLEIFIGHEIPAHTEIVIAPGREYFMRVMAVLREYSTTEGLQIVRDYIKFKQLFLLSIYSGKMKQTKQELGGLETLRLLYVGEDDRSFQCINRVAMINQLGFVSLLDRFWAPQLKENMAQAHHIGEALRREYITALKKSDVIDEIDRARMIDKAERIRIRVAVPEAASSDQELNEESELVANYTEGTESPTQHPWSIFFTAALGNRHWKQISNFGKPLNPAEWPTDTNPFNMNVHYNYEWNSVHFPIIWSYEQYVDARLPSFFSYAGFGSIVGHEMTHAFDFKGRNFGPSGVDQNLTVGKTSRNFEAKEQCFRDQYAALGEARITDDVLAENLADNVALRLSYKAWKAQDELAKKKLPGIDMTSEQAFFTAYAQNWCSVSKLEQASGTHSVGKLRVLGPLQNSRAFADAFSCPVGSPMNPSKKCSLW